ncbi:Raf kinase inhibitor-like YbhB/YbcL family protein [Arthrobacter sp. 1088]|uniref:YbhB/YbcL family Raf kinase inhibitor-like protein n=1 Tax=Arthrobacter sp. 1088 TaxID=2817768 RepID=UPI0028668D30|nr:YbhB/YbcL family Raf kinase inhibitor-like protein [Arthrobacter sp. 1088]MDR6687978.1 Raf kinase inhibitor-like YbhB/YbcL family protein [Arthrobacter sp. 1088]
MQDHELQVASESFNDGDTLGLDQRSGILGAGGKDISPQLSWSGAPDGTRSFAVTMWDPDAPGPGGYWHWAVLNIPPEVSCLPAGSGGKGGHALPAGAFQLKNDGGRSGYVGAAPPRGHGPHRYVVAVHALDVEDLGIEKDSEARILASVLPAHTLARGTITGMFER